jgi:hypothetical protein
MHSRIFQISTKPIKKEDYITESTYWDHWFTNEIADYVNGDTERDYDIQWFKDCYSRKGIEFGADDNGEYIVVKSKEAYFKDAFNRFQELLEKIKAHNLQDFIKGIDEMWELKNEYEEKYGFYIESEEYDLITIDDFIRCCNINEKYYIGATIDYHC